MAEVGEIRPGLPIWPDHHREPQKRRKPADEEQDAPTTDADPEHTGEDDRDGHIDEYA